MSVSLRMNTDTTDTSDIVGAVGARVHRGRKSPGCTVGERAFGRPLGEVRALLKRGAGVAAMSKTARPD